MGDATVATSRVNGAGNAGVAPHQGKTGRGDGETASVTLESTAASLACRLLHAEEEEETGEDTV